MQLPNSFQPFIYLQYNSKEQRYFSASLFSGIFLCLGMYAGAVAGVEIMAWHHHALSPYLMFAIALIAIFSAIVHYKLRVQWQSLQLILISLLLLLVLGEAFASQVFTLFKWVDSLQQTTFLVSTIILSGLFAMAQPQSSHLVTSRYGRVCWLALAIVGVAIFPKMPIVAFGFCSCDLFALGL